MSSVTGIDGRVGTPAAVIVSFAASLSPIAAMASGGGPHPDEASVDHGAGEVGVLRQEAVAGVNGVCAAGLRRGDHLAG